MMYLAKQIMLVQTGSELVNGFFLTAPGQEQSESADVSPAFSVRLQESVSKTAELEKKQLELLDVFAECKDKLDKALKPDPNQREICLKAWMDGEHVESEWLSSREATRILENSEMALAAAQKDMLFCGAVFKQSYENIGVTTQDSQQFSIPLPDELLENVTLKNEVDIGKKLIGGEKLDSNEQTIWNAVVEFYILPPYDQMDSLEQDLKSVFEKHVVDSAAVKGKYWKKPDFVKTSDKCLDSNWTRWEWSFDDAFRNAVQEILR